MKVINYRQLIINLEDEKWRILLVEGEEAAKVKWEEIDKKIKRLWKWSSQEPSTFFRPILRLITTKQNLRVIKNESLEPRQDPK